MENNNYYKYVSRDEFGTVYIVLPNTEKGFNCGYSLFIPTGCNIDTTLLVHCCNTGGYGVTDGILDSSKRAIHLDEANEAAKISSLGGHLNYGYELKMPVLTPLIPRVQGYDTHFFGSRVYNNDISNLIEDKNKIDELFIYPKDGLELKEVLIKAIDFIYSNMDYFKETENIDYTINKDFLINYVNENIDRKW